MHVTHAAIELAAYMRWERRGRPWGTALDDWLAAEQELLTASLRRSKVMTPLERKIEILIQARVAAMLLGPPGVGKTAIMLSVARRLSRPITVLTPSIMEPTDLSGFPRPNPAGFMEWLPPRWAVNLPPDGILFLDEITTAPPLVQNALLRVILERVVGDFQLPDGLAIVAAGNPPQDTATHFRLAPALQNRLAFLFVTPSAAQFSEHFPTFWGERSLCPHRQLIATFIAENPKFLHMMPQNDDQPEMWAWPSPRTWEMAARLMAQTNGQADLACCIGPEAANAFQAWQTKLRAPTAAELLRGGPWPERPQEVLYAAANLAEYIDECVRHDGLSETLFHSALLALSRAPHKDLVLTSFKAILQHRKLSWEVPDEAKAFERIVQLLVEQE